MAVKGTKTPRFHLAAAVNKAVIEFETAIELGATEEDINKSLELIKRRLKIPIQYCERSLTRSNAPVIGQATERWRLEE